MNLVDGMLATGVVNVAKQNSLIFTMLPFLPVSGGSYSYNVVDEVSSAKFRLIGEEAPATGIVPIQKVELLKVLSNDALVDRAVMQMQNVSDIRAVESEVKTVELMTMFEDSFLYGTELEAGFKGLEPRLLEVPAIGTVFTGTITGTAPAELDLLDEVLDAVTGVRNGAGLIVCNSKSKRALSKLMRNCGNLVQTVEVFGHSVIAYDGVPIYVSEAVKDGDIFIMSFDETNGVTGLTNGGLTVKDAGLQGTFYRTAIEFIGAIAVRNPKAFAMIKAPK